ncbi:Chymotrypsinogen B [Desmophyllum pertusum]|uniref:Chymotrypsinogen B n=1 Tax=Desmophyllum pertusum TaxID=174260 RepID=A0A9W9YKM1_9CNID|nr:Chymotrypsinogen B [Desmophyllum pertusum]
MYLAISFLVCFLTPSFIEACGVKPFGSRIVGGEEASPNSWPWQASLQYNGRHICGATVITESWILCAAHCVDQSSDPNRYSLALGAHSRTNDGEVFRVSRVIKHEQFSMQHLRHDVALLKLSKPATLGGKINTICLPQHGSRVSPGTTCYVTGWGRINPSNNQLAPRLKQASAPVASHSECRRTNGGSVDESSMICVGGKGSSVCNGDSGGPLSCKEGNRWVVRGAASWVTSRTCPGHTYSVYSRVSSYINWINGHIQGK